MLVDSEGSVGTGSGPVAFDRGRGDEVEDDAVLETVVSVQVAERVESLEFTVGVCVTANDGERLSATQTFPEY